MDIVIRPLRDDEARIYLEIVNRAIRGLAVTHYAAEHLDGWAVSIDDATLADFARNDDGEIRLLAVGDGVPSGIGALVLATGELRACYVAPRAARNGVGTAIVREIERLARENGLTRLALSASLNAEPFYGRLGYHLINRSEITLRNGHRMPAVQMEKGL
jgi:putative acetyltransferase